MAAAMQNIVSKDLVDQDRDKLSAFSCSPVRGLLSARLILAEEI
jgi:hypothetical protein